MSRFVNHSICQPCFTFRNPGRQPVRISMPLMFCCACGIITNDGILVRGEREAEKNCRCPLGEPDPEHHPEAVIEGARAEEPNSVHNWACVMGERRPISRKESVMYSSGCQKCVIMHRVHTSLMAQVTAAGYEADGSSRVVTDEMFEADAVENGF